MMSPIVPIQFVPSQFPLQLISCFAHDVIIQAMSVRNLQTNHTGHTMAVWCMYTLNSHSLMCTLTYHCMLLFAHTDHCGTYRKGLPQTIHPHCVYDTSTLSHSSEILLLGMKIHLYLV